MRSFAVFDIDGTLIRWQLYHAIADNLVKLGYVDKEAFQDIKEARMTWKRREHSESFKEYELQLVRLYTEILMRLKVEQFKKAARAVFDEHKDQVYTYTRELIKELKAKNYLLFAISGSQEEIVKMIADHYGFDDYTARVDEHEKGSFTGKSTSPIFAKDLALKNLVEKHGASWKGSIGVGDSAGDIKMLEAVEQPIAFNPERKLFEHASKKAWKVVIERKNMVFELESKDGQYILVKTSG